MRLQYGQIFVRLDTDHHRLGFSAIEKSDTQFFGAGNHMKVGQYRAIVLDHDPSAYATLNLGIFVFGICGKSQNTDHCALNGSGCFAALRRYFFGLKRVQNGRINVFLRQDLAAFKGVRKKPHTQQADQNTQQKNSQIIGSIFDFLGIKVLFLG